MATMTKDDKTGVREFSVPFTSPPGGYFSEAPAELLISIGRPGMPRRVSIRYFPQDLEFQLRLFDLVKGTPLEAQGPDLSMSATHGQAVVTFEGDASVTRLLPFRLEDLAALDAFLATEPALLERLEAFSLAAIEVRSPAPL
jgi:hypothetical protein